jgi:Fe-S-cluster containining protein
VIDITEIDRRALETGDWRLETGDWRLIRCLSIHARYVCAHAGACCRAGWTIPVEEHLVEPLRTIGITIGRDRVVQAHADGQCVFFEADAGRLCTIHRRAGAARLPSVCRQFPRVVVTDPRGASITLSHFCPTAAGLLFEPTPLAIVEAPPPLALDGDVEGLDATAVLPPLLSQGVLTDWEGYSAWEEAAVDLFNVAGLEPEQAVLWLEQATELACSWRPGLESLAAAVRRGFSAAALDERDHPDRWNGFGRVVNAFLAAHAFASWAAYECEGLRAVPAAVRRALTLLTSNVSAREPLTRGALTEAIRQTDLELRHARDTTPHVSPSPSARQHGSTSARQHVARQHVARST